MFITCTTARGFTLVETLVAIGLVATALAGIAHVVTIGVGQAAATRRTVVALSLAQSRLETLRSLDWRYDGHGGEVSDAGLALAPGGLDADIAGYADAIDAEGRVLPDLASPARAFSRRWAVSLPDPLDPHTVLLQVCVRAEGDRHRGRADACVAGIRTRQP